MFAGLPRDNKSDEGSKHPSVPLTCSTAYSQLYSDVFRTFSEIVGSTTLLHHHLQTAWMGQNIGLIQGFQTIVQTRFQISKLLNSVFQFMFRTNNSYLLLFFCENCRTFTRDHKQWQYVILYRKYIKKFSALETH